MCKNSGVSQWVAYGYVAVKCHRQQDPRLRDEGGMDEEELSDAAIQGDLPRIEPEDGQSLRDCARGEDKVCSGQHAEEEIHGFMEAPFHEDNADEQAVPKQGNDIGNEEGDGDPHMRSSRPGMPSKWKTVWLTLLWLEAVISGADDMGLHFLFTEIEENIYSLIYSLTGIIQTPSSIVAWRIPWAEESSRLPSKESPE